VAQTENGSPIDLPTPTGIEPSNNNARMPLSLPKNLNLPKAEPMPMEFKVTRNPVKMIDDRNLVPAGAYLNLDPKIKSHVHMAVLTISPLNQTGSGKQLQFKLVPKD